MTISSNTEPDRVTSEPVTGTPRVCRVVAPGRTVCELAPSVSASVSASPSAAKTQQTNKDTIEDAAAATARSLETELWNRYIAEKKATYPNYRNH